MPSALNFEHYNIHTTRLDETVRFYTEVLELRNGHFPGTRNPGAWLYDINDVPVVHIVSAPDEKPAAHTGAINHVAFRASDYEGFCRRLESLGLDFRRNDPRTGLRQIFIKDPNDIQIELNFRQ
jgi:catechol 2,3-dioxygenase-like lactoylglutathione lyase family enzyme